MVHSKVVCRNLLCVRSALTRLCTRHASASATIDTLPFKIPEPIERSPTELLEALSATVGVDVTAPHFSFIDDPAMIPTSQTRKIQYYMCKEFGKRAARQLAMEWPTLFMFDRDQPRLPVFRPEKPLDPLVVEPSDSNLLKMIASREVEDALKLYERIAVNNVDVPSSTVLELFNIVCYYNGRNVPLSEIQEWHGLRNFHDFPKKPSHIEHTAAELLFSNVEKTAHTYSTMVCTLLKFPTKQSVARAKALLQEMITQKFVPTEEVFNLVLRNRIPLVSEKFDVVALLNGMARLGVRPSTLTFNAAISSTLQIGDKEKRLGLIRSLMAEMQACNLPDNLTTFYYLILSSVNNPSAAYPFSCSKEELAIAAGVVRWTMQKLSTEKIISPSEPTDENFFIAAMKVAEGTMNISLGDQLMELFESSRNKVVFSSFINENIFYHAHLLLKLNRVTMSEYEKFYIAYIPRRASLSAVISLKLITKLRNRPHWPMSRRLIEDGIIVGLMGNNYVRAGWEQLLINFPVEKLSETEMDEYRALVTHYLNTVKERNAFNTEKMTMLSRLKTGIEEAASETAADAEKTLTAPEDAAANNDKQATSKQSKSADLIDCTYFESVMIQRGIINAPCD